MKITVIGGVVEVTGPEQLRLDVSPGRPPGARDDRRARSEEARSFDFTGAYAPGAVIPGTEPRPGEARTAPT
jgi:hypothetical protein